MSDREFNSLECYLGQLVALAIRVTYTRLALIVSIGEMPIIVLANIIVPCIQLFELFRMFSLLPMLRLILIVTPEK